MRLREELNPERAREVLLYGPDSGMLRWKSRTGSAQAVRTWNTRFAGKIAGTRHSAGYIQLSIDGELYFAHRVIWLMVHGELPPNGVDHRDLDGFNNRILNLRPATQSQNMANQPPPRNNTSGIKGVYWHKQRQRWVARIKLCKKMQYLGCFSTKEAAGAAYAEAASKIFGEFARTGEQST